MEHSASCQMPRTARPRRILEEYKRDSAKVVTYRLEKYIKTEERSDDSLRPSMLSIQNSFGTINGDTYSFDLSGVVALFGGIYAITVLDTIHLYKGQRWLGWYNYPGMMDVARKYGQLADGPIWNTIFPGGEGEPIQAFGLAGKLGPNYTGFLSGTKIDQTGYLAYLLQQQISREEPHELNLCKGGDKARISSPGTVAIVSLRSAPGSGNEPVHRKGIHFALLGLIPTLVSIATGVLSVLARENVAAALIFSGMLSSGISTFFIGSGQLHFKFPQSSSAAPSGDGLMGYSGNDLIILKGTEEEVSAITRGEFSLVFSQKQDKEHAIPSPLRHAIGIASVLLMVQSLAQLLLISLATLFGQLMYLASLLASSLYYLYMATYTNEMVQGDLLVQEVQSKMEKVTLETRAQMAVFVCLASQDGREIRLPYYDILKLIIPNDTAVWKKWRKCVVAELETWRPEEDRTQFKHLEPSSDQGDNFSEEDRKLYEILLGDARFVFQGYQGEYRQKSKHREKDVSQLPL